MLVFIHGTGSKSAFWLPVIKNLLDLPKLENDQKPYSIGQLFSDTELLQAFCLDLPGHLHSDLDSKENYNDAWFELKDTEKMIEDKIEDFTLAQKQIYDRIYARILEFNKQTNVDLKTNLLIDLPTNLKPDLKLDLDQKLSPLSKLLLSKKLYLVGHSVGGVVAINFAFSNPLAIGGLVLTGCSQKFSLNNISILEKMVDKLYNTKAEKLEQSKKLLGKSTLSTRWQCFVDIINNNPQRLGLKSCIKIAKQYNFESLWNQTSLENQNSFRNMTAINPIHLINGYFDGLSTPLNVHLFGQFCANHSIDLDTKMLATAHDAMDSHPAEFTKIISKLI